MRISEAEQQERKNRIMTTAFRLFCKKGIEQVTLAEVAKGARVGETTVYRYFTNKPLLVLGTLSVLWRSIGGKLETRVNGTDGYGGMSGLEQIGVQLESCRQVYLENRDYVLFSYESKLYLQRNAIQISKGEYDLLMEEIRGSFIAAIDRGKADGTIPIKEDSEDIFYAIWGSIRGYIVKIVIYQSLCTDKGPWESRYPLLKRGIMAALRSGWRFGDEQGSVES